MEWFFFKIIVSCFWDKLTKWIHTHLFFNFLHLWSVKSGMFLQYFHYSLSYPFFTVGAIHLLRICCPTIFASRLNHTRKTPLTECGRAWWFVVWLTELVGAGGVANRTAVTPPPPTSLTRVWQNTSWVTAVASSTNAASLIAPPLDKRKWGKWMVRRDHTGRTDLGYNEDDCKCKGLLNAAEDDSNVIAWNNENE